VGPHLVPNLLIAGVTHSGAADLAQSLSRHPQIKLSASKRVDHYTPIRYGRPLEAPLADYDRHFANWSGQRYRLESSPVYFDGGRTLVNAVTRDLPGARVLVLLRDPAERLWTSYADKIARGRLPRAMTYETFVERCLALRANGADRFEGNRHFRTLSSGFYVEHLTAWLDAFGRRARVVFAEDLMENADVDVVALYDWLGLDASDAPRAEDLEPAAVDPTLEVFEPAAARRMWSFPLQLSRLGAGGPRKPKPLPRQSDRIRNRVATLYAGANGELAALLRDRGYTTLPAWLNPA
jgi:hypothetical protein